MSQQVDEKSIGQKFPLVLIPKSRDHDGFKLIFYCCLRDQLQGESISQNYFTCLFDIIQPKINTRPNRPFTICDSKRQSI